MWLEKWGRRLGSLEKSVGASIRSLEDFIKKCKRRLITATRNNTNNIKISRTNKTRKYIGKKNKYMHISRICIFRQHFFVNTNSIKHNRHFMSTYFLLDPFEFPYYFYRIRGELIYVLSIVVCMTSTFCPTLGHHQGKIYYKSDVTFVLAYYYWVRASLPLKFMAFAFKCNFIISACS